MGLAHGRGRTWLRVMGSGRQVRDTLVQAVTFRANDEGPNADRILRP